MEINIKNYRIELEPHSLVAFNVYKTTRAKKKATGEEYDRETNLAWNVPFSYAVSIVFNDNNPDIKTEKEYVDEKIKFDQQLLILLDERIKQLVKLKKQ